MSTAIHSEDDDLMPITTSWSMPVTPIRKTKRAAGNYPSIVSTVKSPTSSMTGSLSSRKENSRTLLGKRKHEEWRDAFVDGTMFDTVEKTDGSLKRGSFLIQDKHSIFSREDEKKGRLSFSQQESNTLVKDDIALRIYSQLQSNSDMDSHDECGEEDDEDEEEEEGDKDRDEYENKEMKAIERSTTPVVKDLVQKIIPAVNDSPFIRKRERYCCHCREMQCRLPRRILQLNCSCCLKRRMRMRKLIYWDFEKCNFTVFLNGFLSFHFY